MVRKPLEVVGGSDPYAEHIVAQPGQANVAQLEQQLKDTNCIS